ncbi:hypothetical protein RchiOBHm_Chr7g0221271 [Rosa chinensis]|uniref:Uncharacterized protein n=1 Tax=Rosa chinensis TaxID=74649 RepID=A0A2P6PCZ7_ROSCH|nr:hypothetical protein RchiOBHm_Chr7g0221271 [Rosa chinensis]
MDSQKFDGKAPYMFNLNRRLGFLWKVWRLSSGGSRAAPGY